MTLAAAYLLDLLFGDPEHWPHPVRWIGALIERAETVLRRIFPSRERLAGILLTLFVCGVTFGIAFAVTQAARLVHPVLGFLTEAFLIYTALSVKSLKESAMAVWVKLVSGDRDTARQSVGKIVGRDTAQMTDEEVVRATVETVAENTVDGIISPIFYAFLGGAPLALMFKAASTLDSMVGYRSERYVKFGWASARLDDLLNFIPARIAGFLIPLAAWFLRMRWRDSLRTAFRDGRKHPSPNSGIAEAAFAGALGVQLGGVNFREGKAVSYPFLGDRGTPMTHENIPRACQLSLVVSLAWMVILIPFF